MFDKKVVVVTGSAHGIGFGIARRFGQAGAQVILTDKDVEAIAKAAEKLREEGISASSFGMDVRNPYHSDDRVRNIVEEYGRIDIWINNESHVYHGMAESIPAREWEESLAVSLSGAFYCAQAAGKQMLVQGGGVIVNIASVAGIQAVEGKVAYGVANAGLIALTAALGVEWASRGVRVVGIASGVIMGEVYKYPDEVNTMIEVYERRVPLNRLGTIEEVAEAVFFLASEEASYVVGETMRVDGGWISYQLF